eukprot:12131324-Prorocentrum_lima.AAC.1
MTSSLVGSEMCIRDSNCKYLIKTMMEKQQENAEGLWEETSSVQDKVTQEAVSYTHLTLPTICSV